MLYFRKLPQKHGEARDHEAEADERERRAKVREEGALVGEMVARTAVRKAAGGLTLRQRFVWNAYVRFGTTVLAVDGLGSGSGGSSPCGVASPN